MQYAIPPTMHKSSLSPTSSRTLVISYRFDKKAMATHSSTLAWKIPWTEEPGRLQSMGSQRVGHDWVTSLHLFWHVLSSYLIVILIYIPQWLVASFHMPSGYLYTFGKMFIQVLCLFFLSWVACFFDVELCEFFVYFRH